ncbi:universal stress protein [Amycolatopsis lexingtonensis]|uniref:universal stress protein n=1 Tax=Amycolatopsis lexingtonensis TaxID=218822 RepID=UPI003F72B290
MTAPGNPPIVAARRHAPLLLYSAYGLEDASFGGQVRPPSDWLDVRAAAAGRVLRETRAGLEGAVPGLDIATEASARGPVAGLLEVSGRARILVTGPPVGAIAGLFSGSPAVDLAAGARCPVVVVRGRSPVDGPVVVGTDGSPLSEAAIAWAFEEASLRNAPLVALYAGYDGDTAGFSGAETLPESGRLLLAERLAGWQERYPDVAVERRVEHDKPRHRLLSVSHGAQLVVVGSRGRGGFSGLVLGSTSQALLHHAGCPVMVVRTEKPDRRRSR